MAQSSRAPVGQLAVNNHLDPQSMYNNGPPAMGSGPLSCMLRGSRHCQRHRLTPADKEAAPDLFHSCSAMALA